MGEHRGAVGNVFRLFFFLFLCREEPGLHLFNDLDLLSGCGLGHLGWEDCGQTRHPLLVGKTYLGGFFFNVLFRMWAWHTGAGSI